MEAVIHFNDMRILCYYYHIVYYEIITTTVDYYLITIVKNNQFFPSQLEYRYYISQQENSIQRS